MLLRQRIVLVVSLIFITFFLIFYQLGEYRRTQSEQNLAVPVNIGKHYAWQTSVNEQLARMVAQAENLEMSFEIKTALKDGDQTALTKHADVFFNLMKEQKIFNSFLLVDKQGQILYSKPEKFSGACKQNTVKQALETKGYESGLEYDMSGNIVLSLAIPMKSRSGINGAGVFNISLAAIVADASQRDASEIFVLSPDGAIQAGNNKDLLKNLDIDMPPLGEIALFSSALKKQFFSIALQPITGMNGKNIAHLLSVKDITAKHAQERMAAIKVFALMIFVVILALFGLQFYIRRAFRPLMSAIENITAVAEGDFTRSFEIRKKDEIGTMLSALEKMTIALRQTLLRMSATGIKLSEGASYQATALEETSAAIEQIAAITQQSEDNADIAKNIVVQSKNIMDSIVELRTSMEAINEASQKTKAIVNTIDGIAFQTNILALNAAVEAARAGKAGAGFAVVAEEVRNLAMRSAKAAHDTSDLLELTREKILASSQITMRTETEARKVIDEISKIDALMAEITGGSLEQRQGVHQVSQKLLEIHQVTQETANHANKMIRTLNKFHLIPYGQAPVPLLP